jgi:SulP family sulfate permease
MRSSPFRFNLQELGGALGDLGTLLPLMVALILINGLHPTSVLILVGLFYIGSGLYYRTPTPVQPLKAVAAIAITLGLSASVIGTAGLIMGVILLFLSLTNLITVVVRLFPQAVVRGIQLSIGLILLRKGIEFAFSEQTFINGAASRSSDLGQVPLGLLLTVSALLIFILFQFVFFRNSQRFPPSLALLTFGLGAGVIFGYIPGVSKLGPVLPSIALPSAADFWTAFIVLVIPQLPLTLGNAVVGTCDTARTYFNDQAHRVTPRALTTSMGLANIAAGLVGAMPMCHGSGGLTAHYKLGARTGGANLMVGGLILIVGLFLGGAAVPFLSVIPLSVLGVLLAIVGIYHALLIRDLKAKRQMAIAGTVAVGTIALGSLAFGFAAGILLYHILRLDISRVRRPSLEAVKHHRKEEKSPSSINFKQTLAD